MRSSGYTRLGGHPLVSIVIPTFGRPRLLERALSSVFAQTYGHWELIVVDDNDRGSPAARETEGLLARHQHDRRIRYLKHHSNRGGSQARNTGIAAAAGEYIAFLDDDDEWLPQKLEVQCRKLQQLTHDFGLVYCGYYIRSSASSSVAPIPARSFRQPFPRILVDNFIGTTSTLLCRKSALEEVGMFDAQLPAAQDRELLIRLCRRFRIASVREPLVRFNWHDGMRITKRLESKLEALDTIYSRYADELRPHPGLHAQYLVDRAKLLLRFGDRGKATALFCRAWLVHPLKVAPLFYAFFSSVDVSLYEWVRLSTWRLRRGRASRGGRYR
jgi:glycosyltransferase involved in cell wall biosynthesis